MLHWRLNSPADLPDESCRGNASAAAGSFIDYVMVQMRALTGIILVTGLGLGLAGCGVSLAPLPAGSVAGRAQLYDYSPSVIQSGDLQKIWWCGSGYNPADVTQYSDTIQYESINLATKARYGPLPVLAETQGAWDSDFTCNPKVIMGFFANPLGNGESFTYAMYYVALGSTANNFIGVAFSRDGLSWKKYPHPIISPETSDGYGVGQPAVYNTDQRGAIRMFYEDNCYGLHHVEATSNDGVHFSILGTLTTHGLDPDSQTWGDMAYDSQTGYWYAAFNTDLRDPSTTGGVLERGQYGIKLYRISDASLLTGATPWELVATVDTSLTGYESNFIPGFVRDMYGNLMPGPAVQMLTSISDPPPPWNATPKAAGMSGSIANWKLSSFQWTPGSPLTALNRYFNQTVHEVTTGWIDPNGGFSLQSTLGHLYQSPQQAATLPFYGCKNGSTDYFVSLDSACEGARILGINGYGYSAPVAGLNLTALYRCSTGHDHFVSADPKCESQSTQQLLGYVLP
jgi:hypothetical protein